MEKLPFQYEKKQYWEYYCPICKVLRRSAYTPSPTVKHYAQLALTAFFLTVVLWPWTHAKGAFLIFPVWAVFEFFYRARARQSFICHKCGFDPFLFKFDTKLAKGKVEKFFKSRERKPTTPTSEIPTVPPTEAPASSTSINR